MKKTKQSKLELYVTHVEQETYDLGGQLALANVRSHVEPRTTSYSQGGGKAYWVVVVDAPEAWDRAVSVRRVMFGS